MLVGEYREFEKKAKALYRKDFSLHKVDTLILADRLDIHPDKVARLHHRDTDLVREYHKLILELEPARIVVEGKAPWIVKNVGCDKCKSLICSEHTSDAEEFCRVRDIRFRDIEFLGDDMMVETLTDGYCGDWDWSIYQTVKEVAVRIRTSPLARWNGKVK